MGESSVRAVGWARCIPLSSGAKAARDWTLEHLQTLGWTEDAPDTVDSVLLAVSELVTNAHLHAHSAAQLMLTWDNQCLHIAVHDGSTDLPTPKPPSTERLGGRGMFLVDALADGWEAQRCTHGKTVLACFRPPTADGGGGCCAALDGSRTPDARGEA
ncbi:ATP-binding protein [Streptomyces sp. CRN 30]|uniref:ATP-binding protein n=1 Tax=Streptomyces sp. CRN 30 TaxID=3075613 RepID=UPI002A802E0C|nr:ATP-binding protein [Streptomyces sp. CRN 30]